MDIDIAILEVQLRPHIRHLTLSRNKLLLMIEIIESGMDWLIRQELKEIPLVCSESHWPTDGTENDNLDDNCTKILNLIRKQYNVKQTARGNRENVRRLSNYSSQEPRRRARHSRAFQRLQADIFSQFAYVTRRLHDEDFFNITRGGAGPAAPCPN